MIKLSFDWAEKGSFQELEKELGRVISERTEVLQKSARPSYYDMLHSDDPVSSRVKKDLQSYMEKNVATSVLDMAVGGKPIPAAVMSHMEISNKHPFPDSFSTFPRKIPDTQRRWLGILPPKIKLKDPAHLSIATGLHKDNPDAADTSTGYTRYLTNGSPISDALPDAVIEQLVNSAVKDRSKNPPNPRKDMAFWLKPEKKSSHTVGASEQYFRNYGPFYYSTRIGPSTGVGEPITLQEIMDGRLPYLRSTKSSAVKKAFPYWLAAGLPVAGVGAAAGAIGAPKDHKVEGAGRGATHGLFAGGGGLIGGSIGALAGGVPGALIGAGLGGAGGWSLGRQLTGPSSWEMEAHRQRLREEILDQLMASGHLHEETAKPPMPKKAISAPVTTGATGGADFPQPQPTFMEGAKSTLNNAMTSTQGFLRGMPTWATGALLGSGIGALGGLMTDRKKLRGLLQGGLLGAGLGGLGGHFFPGVVNSVTGMSTEPAKAVAGGTEPWKPDPPPPEKPQTFAKQNPFINRITGIGQPPSIEQTAISGGLLGAGTVLSKVKPLERVISSDMVDKTPGAKTQILSRATPKELSSYLASTPEALEDALKTHLTKTVNAGPGTPATSIPAELHPGFIGDLMNQVEKAQGAAPHTVRIMDNAGKSYTVPFSELHPGPTQTGGITPAVVNANADVYSQRARDWLQKNVAPTERPGAPAAAVTPDTANLAGTVAALKNQDIRVHSPGGLVRLRGAENIPVQGSDGATYNIPRSELARTVSDKLLAGREPPLLGRILGSSPKVISTLNRAKTIGSRGLQGAGLLGLSSQGYNLIQGLKGPQLTPLQESVKDLGTGLTPNQETLSSFANHISATAKETGPLNANDVSQQLQKTFSGLTPEQITNVMRALREYTK